MGLVVSLSRPGANLTGTAVLTGELSPKRLQLLRELIPDAAVFGVLVDPAPPNAQSITTDLPAARTLGLQLVIVNARTDSDLETAFASFSQQQRVGAVLVGSSNLYNRRTEQLAALAARYTMPAIYAFREFALAGGLMSYGSNLGYTWHQAGIYTGRILRGEKPADLPVQAPTQYDLVINLKSQSPRPHHPGNAVGDCR